MDDGGRQQVESSFPLPPEDYALKYTNEMVEIIVVPSSLWRNRFVEDSRGR